MLWKEDWDDAKQRLLAWWNGEIIDRPALGVRAPKKKPIEEISLVNTPSDLVSRWIDPYYRINGAERWMVSTFFGGEAFPFFGTDMGPGSLATFLGSEPKFAEDTVWYTPYIKDPDIFTSLNFNTKNRWWKIQHNLVKEGACANKGRYLVGMPDLIEGLDTLASLRGTTNLLLDLHLRPKFVHARLEEITNLYFVYFDNLFELIKDKDGGNCFGAFLIWGSGKTAKVQCDFSAMISQKQFAEFVVPYLQEQCSKLDYSVFHLDGPECIRHLDLLLNIEQLGAIQWTPGVNQPDSGSREWYKMYKKILKAGKSLLILGVPPSKVKNIYNKVNRSGVFITTDVSSEYEAHRLIENIK
jgi:hypothetical protein